MLTGNKDDHLRNHGFLYINHGWELSPAFDLEISPDKASHAIALDDRGSLSASLQQILLMAEYYGLSYAEAKQLLLDFAEIVFDFAMLAKNRVGGTFVRPSHTTRTCGSRIRRFLNKKDRSIHDLLIP